VRLASKLIGWNIDIKSEEEKRREIEAQMAALTAPGTALTELAGVGPKTIEKLEAAGISSIEKLADMTPEQLVEIPGIGEKMVEKIHQSVAAYFEALETAAAAPPEAVGVGEGDGAVAETETEVAAEEEAASVDEATEEATEQVATDENGPPQEDAAVSPVDAEAEAEALDEATEEASEEVREQEIGGTEESAEKP
jgi:N utilization substance protein A